MLGTKNIDFVAVLVNLGILYHDMLNFKKAEISYLEAKVIFENVIFNSNHNYYLNCLNNLANLYMDQNRVSEAEFLYNRIINICEGNQKEKELIYAIVLVNLGLLMKDKGNFEKAEKYYLMAKSIEENLLSKESLEYRSTISNLANLYSKMGNYKKAEMMLLENDKILFRVFGKDNVRYLGNLINLAGNYCNLSNFKYAESLLLDAKYIFENKNKLINHQYYLNCLSQLGRLYLMIGDYLTGEQFYIKISKYFEIEGNKKNDFYYNSMVGLSVCNINLGKYENAEKLLHEIRHYQELNLIKNNPNYIFNLLSLSNLYERQKRTKESDLILFQCYDLLIKNILDATRFLSYKELEAFNKTFNFNFMNLNDIVFDRLNKGVQCQDIINLTFNNTLFLNNLFCCIQIFIKIYCI